MLEQKKVISELLTCKYVLEEALDNRNGEVLLDDFLEVSLACAEVVGRLSMMVEVLSEGMSESEKFMNALDHFMKYQYDRYLGQGSPVEDDEELNLGDAVVEEEDEKVIPIPKKKN